jgi:hypothetical protein
MEESDVTNDEFFYSGLTLKNIKRKQGNNRRQE